MLFDLGIGMSAIILVVLGLLGASLRILREY